MLKTKRNLVLWILIAVFLLSAVLVVIVWVSGRDPEPAEAAIFPTPQPTAQVVIKEVEKLVEVEKTISSDILQDGLNDMGFLVTQEYVFTEVVSFSSVKKLLKTDIELKFTETSYLATYDGSVYAGVDFSRIRVEKSDGAKRITVYLPAAEIQTVSIDPNSFVLYSEKAGLGNPLSAQDFNTSLVELENTAREKAVERGVLTQADKNAKAMVQNFIAGLVDTSAYRVDFVTI